VDCADTKSVVKMQNKLQTKMTQMVNANGMAAVDYSTNFVIYPVVNIEDEGVV